MSWNALHFTAEMMGGFKVKAKYIIIIYLNQAARPTHTQKLHLLQ